MIGVKLYCFAGVGANQDNFALFQRILRSQSSTRPGRPSQACVVGESPNVDIDQPSFVIDGEGIASDDVVSVC